MSIRILSSGTETRTPGYTPSGAISAGSVVQLYTADTTGKTIVVATTGIPIGISLNDTFVNTIDPRVNYDNYNRGGLVSTVGLTPGISIEVWDYDLDVVGTTKSALLDTTYTLGNYVKWDGSAKKYVDAGSTLAGSIGVITKVPADSSDSLVFVII